MALLTERRCDLSSCNRVLRRVVELRMVVAVDEEDGRHHEHDLRAQVCSEAHGLTAARAFIEKGFGAQSAVETRSATRERAAAETFLRELLTNAPNRMVKSKEVYADASSDPRVVMADMIRLAKALDVLVEATINRVHVVVRGDDSVDTAFASYSKRLR